MSRTRVQQTQISGSLSSDILDNLAAGSELAAQSTLVGDLNALRSQLNKIIGVGNWYDELSGTQDLADVYGAMHVSGADAAFQGDVSAVGDLSAIGGDFTVQAAVSFTENGYLAYNTQSNVGVDIDLKPSNGDRTGVFLAGTNIFVVDTSASPPQVGYRTVASSTYNGSFTRVTVSTPVSGWLIGVVGDPAPPGAGILLNLSSSPALLSMNGDVKIVGDVAQRLYVVGADGEIKDESGLSYDPAGGPLGNGQLSVLGNVSASDTVSATSGSFSGITIVNETPGRLYLVGADYSITDSEFLTFDGSALSVAGAGSFTGNITAASGSFTGDLSVSGNVTAISGSFDKVVGGKIFIDGDTATRLYIVDADGSIKDESKLTFDGSELSVDGDLAASGDLSAVGGDFSVAAGLAGTPEGGYLGYAAYGEAWAVTILGSNVAGLFPDGTPVAIYNSSDWTIPPHYTTVYSANGQPSGGAYNAGGAYTVMNLNAGMGALAYNAVVALVGNPAPSGAAVLINTSSPAVLSMTGSIKISGDVAQRLYIVGADGEIKDESKLTFDGSELAIDGDVSAANIYLTGDLSTEAGTLTAATGSFVEVSVSGKISIEGDTATRLYIVDADGSIKDEEKLTFDGSELSIDGDLAAADGHFTGNVQVDGDLRVKGSMTYIDTQNMRVQDAFIYLATGSAGTTDSGIVLARGAGADMDLVIGQDGGAGEVIFGKADRAPDGGGAGDAMHGIELVPAWMSEIKLGGVEGSLSGSFSIEGNNMKLEAANDLTLAANGESVGLMSAADYTLFDSNFSATSIVGALNELYAAGAGGAAKGNLALSDVTVDVLDFSAVGTLNSADHKFIDVYLNGVLLAPGIDVTAVAVDNVTLAAGVVSELAVDDVFTVVLRGAANS